MIATRVCATAAAEGGFICGTLSSDIGMRSVLGSELSIGAWAIIALKIPDFRPSSSASTVVSRLTATGISSWYTICTHG